MSFTRAIVGIDYKIETGKLRLVSKIDEISQRIIVTLKHNWQEYFMNVPAGVPWYELILGSRNLPQVEIILKDIILSVPGVVSITNYQGIFNNDREYSITVSVEVFVRNVTDIIDIVETFLIGG